MDGESVRKLLQQLGSVRKIKTSTDGFVHCNCIFAPYNEAHNSGFDRRPSMWVTVDRGASYVGCYTCNSNMGFIDALRQVNVFSGGQYKHVVDEAEKLEDLRGARPNFQVYRPHDYGEDFAKFRTQEQLNALPVEFLAEKGVKDQLTIEQFKLGIDATQGLLLFPIIMRNGTIVGAQARSVVNAQSLGGKYFSYFPDTQKSHHLFGEHLLSLDRVSSPGGRIDYRFTGRTIIIFEGPLDTMHAFEVGIRNVVGIMGAKISPEQVRLIGALVGQRAVAMLLDPDKAGRQGAISSINEVFTEHAPNTTVRLFCPKKDPKQMSRQEFIDLLQGEDTWHKRSPADLLKELQGPVRRKTSGS